MLKIRRSHDRLILNMGILIPGKDGHYIETGPCISKRSLADDVGEEHIVVLVIILI